MKPCEGRIESITLMVAGEKLPDREAAELQVHLDQCAGCRMHADKMARLCNEHREAADIHRQRGTELDSKTLRKVASEIRSRPETSRWLRPQFAALAMLIALAGGWLRLKMEPGRPPAGTGIQIVQQPPLNPSRQPEPLATEPSLQSYRRAFARSPQALDELLASQAVAVHTGHAASAPSEEPIKLSHRE